MSKEETKKYSVKYKRNRSSRACEVCHSRKVRCDATIHIPCTNCLTFGSECRFPEPKERKNARVKKNPQTHTHEHDSQDSHTATPQLKQEHLAQPQQSVPAVTIPATSAPASKRRHEPLAAISARSASIDSHNLSKHNMELSFHGKASTAFVLAVDSSKGPLHLGDYVPPEMKNSIDQTRVGLDTVQMEILRLRGAFLLPEKGLCDDLVETFFEHIYPIEPIVDRASFMKDYESGNVSLLLLQSIFLAASRVSDNELIFDSNRSNYLTSATFYQRAKALYEANYEKDPIPIIQSLSLFSRFWEGVDDILGNSFYWTRIAITAAQGFGFHRNMARFGSTFSPEEMRIGRILWWNLYIRDISCSVAFGRPRVIHLEDCDVPMLKVEDFTPDLPRHDAEAFVHMIRLSEIMSIVLQEQYSVRAEKAKKHRDQLVMTHCDMIMSSWRSKLPPQLQYAPHQHLPLSVNILNLYYYSAVCLVHRSNMVRTVSGKQYPSEGIVFKASRIIADIASKLLKSNDIRYCHALVIPVFFTATLTFICHMDSDNPHISKSAKLGYEVCSKALGEIGKNFLIAMLIQHGLARFAEDQKLRERLVNSMVRKVATTNGAPTPMYQSAAPTPGPTPAPAPSAQAFNGGQFAGQSFVDFSTPQNATPQNATPSLSPEVPMQDMPLPFNGQPQQSQQTQQAPPPAQQQQQNLEFPDLYLFTNTLPSNGTNEFDPAELFPSNQSLKPETLEDESSKAARSDTTDGFINTDFHMNLPEFDFQNFTNAISFQNLASLNSYLAPTDSHSGSESNIYNFVN